MANTLVVNKVIFLNIFILFCYDSNLTGSASQFDAVFFHIRNMELIGQWPDVTVKRPDKWPNPSERKPFQRYVMFLDESPLNSWFPFERFGNFFNW